MKTKLIIITTAVILIITVLLLFDLHKESEKEVVRQFKAEQLVDSRRLAKEIESYLHERAKGVNILSSFPSFQIRDIKKMTADIQTFFDYVKKNHIKSVSVYDEKGTIIYSTTKEAIGRNYAECDFFEWAVKKENKDKQFVSSLIKKTDDRTAPLPYFRFLLAVPIYRKATGANHLEHGDKFAGIVTSTIDLEEIVSAFLPLVSAYTSKEYAYILDSSGTVLFHSEHPEMVLRNIRSQNTTCFQCHTSFDHVKTILSGKEGAVEYALKERPKKLASFSSTEFTNISWKIVISIPYEEVSGFMSKHLYMTIILIGIITLTLIRGSSLIYRNNRLKIRAEEETKQWMEKRKLEDKIRESEEHYRTVVDISPNAIIIHSEGKIVFANPAAVKLAGAKSPNDFLGKPVIEFVHPDDRESVGKSILEILKSGKSSSLVEERFIKLDGSTIYVETVGTSTTYYGKPSVHVIVRDITERKRVEDTLRSREAYLSAIIENQPGLIWLKDTESRFLSVNNTFAASCGKQTPAEIVGKTDLDIWPRELADKYRNDDALVMKSAKSFSVEEQINVKGETKWFETFKTPVKDVNGRIMGTTGFARDITERKLAEKVLHDSEEKYRKLVELSPDALLIHIDGIIQFVNSASVKLFDAVSKDNLIGKEVINLVHPDYRNIVRQRIGKIVDEKVEVPMIEEKLITLKGVAFDAEVKAIPISLMGCNGVQVIARDITERKKTEKELLRLNDQLMEAQRITHSGSWEADFISGKLIWSDEMYRIYGVDRESFGHTREALLELLHPDDRHILLDSFQRIFSGKQNILSHQFRIVHPDGSIHFVESSNKAYFDSSGKPVRVIGVTQDITERKLVEEKLLASEIRYRRLFESAKDGILILDAKTGKILDVNPFLANLLGYSKIELTGKNVWEIGFLENIVSNQNKFFELQQKKYVRYEDLPLETTDGRKINVEFVSNVYLVNNQEVIQCNIRDITERKRAEEEIKESKIQLEKLYQRLNDIRENERAEISREIHDELGQSLTALKMDLNWSKENVANKMLIGKKLNSMLNVVSETIKKVQKISSALRPGMLDDLGLIPAIQWYCHEFEERTGLKCSLELEKLPSLNSQINLTLFRILQEGLTNIIRHANAKSVVVKLHSSTGKIYINITDDGIGISNEKIISKDSLGLIGMNERLKQFNGTLEIISPKNKGTSLIVSIPIIG